MTKYALSIKQPWAALIAIGFKPIENRTWQTKFRGEFYIHASKKPDELTLMNICEEYGLDFSGIARIIDLSLGGLHNGGIIGKARLVDCVSYSPSMWFCGPYGFVIEGAEPIDFIPCRGRLNFFPVEI